MVSSTRIVIDNDTEMVMILMRNLAKIWIYSDDGYDCNGNKFVQDLSPKYYNYIMNGPHGMTYKLEIHKSPRMMIMTPMGIAKH